MNDESNGFSDMNAGAEENARYDEQRRYGDNLPPAETESYEEVPKSAPKPRKSGGVSKVVTTLTAAVAAVVFAVVAAPAVIVTDKTTVRFAEMWATDTTIGYFVTLENRSEDELRIVVYDEFTERSQPIEGTEVAGEATGLKPDMSYKIAVKRGDKTVAETSLRTKRTEDMPQTALHSVTHECTCDVDGLFHFQMDFIDENQYWFDFGATLTDMYGTVSECEFTDDPHAEQTIRVSAADLSGSEATFRITCFSGETGTEIVLYETTVQI